ncbi:hypothetical protein P5V15_003351 [Pogonomyrmex californicus]
MIGLLQLYLPNKYSHLYGNDTRGTRLMNLLMLGTGTIDFLRENSQYLAQQVPDVTPQSGDTYDFIVIGAGTAGATIAARLSEIAQVKVLLIEAGTYDNLFMGIPLTAGLLQLINISWNYQTKPSDKYCQGMENNSCACPTGKVIGGSSVLNFMIASRGAAEDYDRWARMGNEGWAYKDVLKYFKKLETIDVPKLKDSIYHGTEGPVHISQAEFHTPLAEAFMKAVKELGYPLVDYNGKSMMGFSYIQSTIMNGMRISSNKAYLHPARDRKNLHVTLTSTVKKLLIDPNTNRAIGVEFVKGDQTIRAFASKEVIMCAGTIGTSQLLMLSGIGPAKQLNKLGIQVVRDAPVGENLMDHISYYGLTWMINASISIELLNQINPFNPYLTDFFIKRSGPLTLPGACEIIGFINTEDPEKHDSPPDIELLFASASFKGEYIFSRLLRLNKSLRQKWDEQIGSHGWSLGIILLKPKSRGRITLLANDINVKPEIVPNYLDHPDDVKTTIAGIRAALNISQTKSMRAFDSQLFNITYTECNKYKYDSNDYWTCALKLLASTLFHFSGTCKMGPKGDPTAVVDPRLKVFGVQGLRVADASIMPEIISGHINLPVYMIAEKAADLIKEDWGYLEKS